MPYLFSLILCIAYMRWCQAAMEITSEPQTAQRIYYSFSTITPTKGIVFLFHGCSHSGADWDVLPVERTIVQAVNARGFTAVALTSADTDHRCWMGEDIPRVVAAINHMYGIVHSRTPAEGSSDAKNTYLLGASSGGSFVFEFAKVSRELYDLDVLAVCVQISATRGSAGASVPTLFVDMLRDKRTAHAVERTVRALQRDRVPVQQLSCAPKAMLPGGDFFHTHGQVLSVEDSRLATAALKREGYLAPDGMLLEDPRGSGWRAVLSNALPHIVPEKDSLVADRSGLSELMNLAWAAHEITDEHLDDTLAFFETHNKPPSRPPQTVTRELLL